MNHMPNLDTVYEGEASDLKDYLAYVVKLHGDRPSIDKIILEHGKEYKYDKDSFVGGKRHQCFKNAALAAFEGDTYVEGYVDTYGVPIHHAWIVQNGLVRDVTIGGAEGIRGYFGVPIKQEFLRLTLLKAKVYGIFTYTNFKQLVKAKPEDMVENN